MQEFKTSLLREKFTLKSVEGNDPDIIALSNRMVVPLISADGIDNEIFVVRTQNMHSCARFSAVLVKEFYERGSLLTRAMPIKWAQLWDDVIKGYEKDWNPNIWCALYHKGRLVFHQGSHHPFLDIIEKCDAANKAKYNESLAFAEQAFGQAGKAVTIQYDSNIALVTSTTEERAKCGIIVRSPIGATTFNYTAVKKEDNPQTIHPYTTITVAAAFLELVQLSFQVGLMNKKQQFQLYDPHSDEDKKHRRAKDRAVNLERAISHYEANFSVMYRPDRPHLKEMVSAAETYSIKMLKPEIENKIANGTLDAKDWVV